MRAASPPHTHAHAPTLTFRVWTTTTRLTAAANEANALKYLKSEGCYLGGHVDDRQLSGEVLVNLSLAGTAVMTYTYDKDVSALPPVRVTLPRRSLQIQTKEVRFDWRHGIEGKDLPDVRVSITFRRAKFHG